MLDAEALLMIGTDLPYRQFYPDVPVLQIDSRGEQIGKRVPVEVPLVGTAKETLRELTAMLRPAKTSKHLTKMRDHYTKTRKKLDDLAHPSRGSRPIHPQYLTRVVDERATEDVVFIPDVGSPVIYASRYIDTTRDRRVIGSFAHGSMANALTMALGAQASSPDRQIIALAGDGGLGMMLGELLTVREHDLSIKVVVYNNSSLNFIELERRPMVSYRLQPT